jgi:predicted CXXCH cytochrome family protein
MIGFGVASLLSANRQNSVCAGCHRTQVDRHWLGSAHERADVSCAACHAVHTADDPVRQPGMQVEVCGRCHQEQHMVGLQRGGHSTRSGGPRHSGGPRDNGAPLSGAQLLCTDCHAAHGSDNPAALKQSNINDNCYSCHAEKRGPLLWEHEPVSEDCSICHDPHGSVNPDLLVQRTPQLCQSCHSAIGHAAAPYGSQNSIFVLGDSCGNCHAAVHGSNHPSGNSLQR